MVKKTYKLRICGSDYIISAEESEEYMQTLASEIDEKLRNVLRNAKLSSTQAAIFVALELADEAKKATDSADNLRAQVKDYLEDAAKAKSERDFYKRELERLKIEDEKKPSTGIWGN
ncbi:MAG: Cell division protein ZapA [Firmicutes bacterium ADurb.Bin300]|nr:MAG: Cell division protein ZapA [Firmicutes bacterium ADurb.Bin300]HOD01760.1 cell division protein ZapA [Clostridiales bacterium]